MLDIKGYSHFDFEGRPGVTYARTAAEINTALLEVIAFARERGGEALRAKQAGREPTFAPVFVVFEDIGAAMSKLSKPAQQAWDDILSTGRGVAVHAIALPQRPDVQYLGPGSIRDNLGNRMLMSGHGDCARKMVAAGRRLRTPAQKRGRFVVLDGLVGIHTQGILDDNGTIERELDTLLGPRQRDEELVPAGATPLRDNHSGNGRHAAHGAHVPRRRRGYGGGVRSRNHCLCFPARRRRHGHPPWPVRHTRLCRRYISHTTPLAVVRPRDRGRGYG